jgi:hypothetical protein
MRGSWMVLLVLPSLALAAPSVDPIRQCMTANLPQTLRVQEVELTTWDRAGQERQMKGRIFGARDDDRGRLMARVEYPGDLAGTAFLVREASSGKSEMYVYLPGTNRVKRLTGSHMNGKLWGTDFSYNEFRRVSNAFAGGSVEVSRAALHEGRPVHELTLTPPPAEREPYDRIRVLVDVASCVPLHAEFSKGARLRKVLTVPSAGLRKAGAHWYAAEVQLRDVLEGTRTRLRVLGVTAGARLSKGHFHPQQFYSVH